MTVLRAGAATDVGRVRPSNEDMSLESPTLYAVADGMGGHAGGEVAARTAVEALGDHFLRVPTASGLVGAVAAANAEVWRRGQQDPDLHGMGTTLVAAGLVSDPSGDDVVLLVNVGDSRAYVLTGDDLVQVTADHSLAEEKVRLGEMTEAQAAVHPHRHILTRALGVGPGVHPDLWELHLRSGERILLCSDGLSNEATSGEMARVLRTVTDPDQAAQALVDLANAHGGSDNITAVVVDVLVGEDRPAAALAVPLDARPLSPVGAAGDLGGPPGTDRIGAAAPVGAPDQLPTPGPSAAGAEDPPTTAVPVVPAGTQSGTGPAGTQSGTGPAGTQSGTGPAGTGADPTMLGLGGPAQPPGTDPTAATNVLVTAPPGAGKSSTAPAGGGKAGKRQRRRGTRQRRVTLRVVLFILLVAAVVAAAYFVVRWYATDAYFVAIDHGELVVYQGRPGGLLGFDPQLVSRTGVTTAQVMPSRLPALRATVSEPTRQAGVRYIHNLRQEAIQQRQITAGGGTGEVFATTTTTTTTVPGQVPTGTGTVPPPTLPPIAPTTLP